MLNCYYNTAYYRYKTRWATARPIVDTMTSLAVSHSMYSPLFSCLFLILVN